jgi:hypothetical protein
MMFFEPVAINFATPLSASASGEPDKLDIWQSLK